MSSIIYLYVKQHTLTGLKYFGKTTSKNPFKYSGSGTRWRRHIKKHGKEYIITLEVWGFDDQELCTEFALKFSEENNIVESDEWANFIPENGLNGGVTVPVLWDDEMRIRQSKIHKELWEDPDYRNKMMKRPVHFHSEETKRKIGDKHKGKKLSDEHKTRLSEVGKTRIGDKNPFYGKSHSEETKIKLSNKRKARKVGPPSEESKKLMSIAAKNRIRERGSCPYCGIEGVIANLKRWHFDKCKHKPEV